MVWCCQSSCNLKNIYERTLILPECVVAFPRVLQLRKVNTVLPYSLSQRQTSHAFESQGLTKW